MFFHLIVREPIPELDASPGDEIVIDTSRTPPVARLREFPIWAADMLLRNRENVTLRHGKWADLEALRKEKGAGG